MNELPKNPIMLLSFVNTELRDNCSDLMEFCCVHNVDINILIGHLKSIGYTYDSTVNRFI